MITYTKIGKKGNLGNQLFQIASTIGLSIAHNRAFSFLDWKYQHYFKNKLPLLTADFSDFIKLREKSYNYHEWDFEDKNYDIAGWLQTEKYFDNVLTKYYFDFSEILVDRIKQIYHKAFEKRTILISIRRGDFVNHADYFQLPVHYYLNSLIQFFPDWESCNLIVLSDDIKYCKFHFSFLENVFFGEGLNEVEQLCLGSLCDDFIISNSTFSWWTAWLGEKSDSKVIRPLKNFDGLKSQQLDDKDYYPERWLQYNYFQEKIKLENLAFLITSNKNSEEIKTYLLSYFDVEFISNEKKINNYESIYVVNKDYFLPPLLIYFSWLKLKKSDYSIIINSIIKTFNVSKTLDYKDFFLQKDFGLFSKVFSFSKNRKIKQSQHSDIYLKRNNNCDKIGEKNQFWICFSGGQFCNIGGYGYSFKGFVKRREIQLKRSIKNLLSIK